jgi:hypothetical protein
MASPYALIYKDMVSSRSPSTIAGSVTGNNHIEK